MKSLIGKPGQTIIDVAIEKTGSVEGIKTFFELNENVLDAESIEGMTLKYDPQIIDGSIVNYFSKNNKTIVTR